MTQPRELEQALEDRRDIALAILDGEVDIDLAVAFEMALQDADRRRSRR